MKITYSHVEAAFRESIEKECANRIEKLRRLLKRYAPDLVQLHSTIEKTPRKTEYSFSLSLTLPTGALYATGRGADVPTSARAAFTEIESQLKKHLEKLRKDYVWKRKRPRAGLKPGETTAVG
jgi:ribosome-associated translation inhibitor RaiA